MRWWLLVSLLGGCDVVLGLDRNAPDAALADAPTFDPSICPPAYKAISGQPTRYRFIVSFTAWASAFTLCQDEGTHLAILETSLEAQALTNNAQALEAPFFYIGLQQAPSQTMVGDAWTWLDGSSFDARMWAPGEPEDGDGVENGGEQRGALARDGDGDDIVDHPGDVPLFAICECDGRLR